MLWPLFELFAIKKDLSENCLIRMGPVSSLLTDWLGRNKALARPRPSRVHQSRLPLTFRPLAKIETEST